MRHFFTAIFILFFSTAFGQVAKIDSSFAFTTNSMQVSRIDSFVFASRTYAIPRDCDKKDQSNCCSYLSNPGQVGCNNGTSLGWYFMPTLNIAKENVESIASQWEKQMKTFSKKKIICYLLDKEVEGFNISYSTKDGNKGSLIITSGVVDGKAVVLELGSQKELKKNNDIQPVFRQILKLK
jgi:hypothetical protein